MRLWLSVPGVGQAVFDSGSGLAGPFPGRMHLLDWVGPEPPHSDDTRQRHQLWRPSGQTRGTWSLGVAFTRNTPQLPPEANSPTGKLL